MDIDDSREQTTSAVACCELQKASGEIERRE
jgi:hypothetical protein